MHVQQNIKIPREIYIKFRGNPYSRSSTDTVLTDKQKEEGDELKRTRLYIFCRKSMLS